jgi:hypothetical protein
MRKVSGPRSEALLAEFRDRMRQAAAYWRRRGDEAEAHRCESAARWAMERASWLDRGDEE